MLYNKFFKMSLWKFGKVSLTEFYFCYASSAELILHRDYLFLYYTTITVANFKNLEHKSLQQKENSNFTSAWTRKVVCIKSVH